MATHDPRLLNLPKDVLARALRALLRRAAEDRHSPLHYLVLQDIDADRSVVITRAEAESVIGPHSIRDDGDLRVLACVDLDPTRVGSGPWPYKDVVFWSVPQHAVLMQPSDVDGRIDAIREATH